MAVSLTDSRGNFIGIDTSGPGSINKFPWNMPQGSNPLSRYPFTRSGSTPTYKSGSAGTGNIYGPPSSPSSLGYLSPSRAAAQARDMRSAAASRAAAQEEGMSPFETWLDMVNQMGGGGGGGYGGPSRAQIQAQGAAARARLESLYKQYADMIAGRAGTIKQNYQQAGENLSGIYGGAESNINNAYNAARQAQTDQLRALGLTEMAPPTNTDQQAYMASMLNRLGAAGMAENTAAQTAALANNLALQNAATAEGTRTLSSFDAALANALASAGSGGGGGGGGGSSIRPSDLLNAMKFQYEVEQDAYSAANKPAQQDPIKAFIAAQQAYPDMDPDILAKLVGYM